MISAKICNPDSKRSFMEFTHGTTCIVGVPHGAESKLWVTADRPSTLVIEASGHEIQVIQITPPGGGILISRLQQPLQRNATGNLRNLLAGMLRRHSAQNAGQRLYNFRAMVEDGTPQRRGNLLATFDFHLLCETDFHWARAYHLKLDLDPDAASVADRAEGICPHCQEVRAKLEKNWSYES